MKLISDLGLHRKSKRDAPVLTFLVLILASQITISPVSASGILTDLAASAYERLFPDEDYIDDDFETKTLNIVEISEMRARDIKRRLARAHGYDPDELGRMIDKKDLINALSFEEHKAYQQEADRRKWIRFKTTLIYSCAAVMAVMCWPLIKHALAVAHVNFELYTDRRKYEIRRCREFNSLKGYFGILLLLILDMLSFWLSASVILSWVMRSKWFFPVPYLPIRPGQLLTPGEAGVFSGYGINVGPMLISWLFRFLSGKVQAMIGKAMSEALGRKKKQEKEKLKSMRKEERRREKEARRESRRQTKKVKAERVVHRNVAEEHYDSSDSSGDENSYSGMTASNVVRNMARFEDFDSKANNSREPEELSSNFDDLD